MFWLFVGIIAVLGLQAYIEDMQAIQSKLRSLKKGINLR